jgi:hypothetical protein
MHLPRQTRLVNSKSVKYFIYNHLTEIRPFRHNNPPRPAGKLYPELDAGWLKFDYVAYRRGVFTICFSAAMRSSSGGWVLNNEESVPLPNIGFTMHSAEVLGEIAVVGIRRL